MKSFRSLAFSIIILVGVLGIVLHAAIKSSAPERIVKKYADCHVHLLDFLQNGEFMNADKKFPGGVFGEQDDTGRFVSLPFGERGRRIEALLESMDEAQVHNALVCGMPFIKKWSQNEPFQRPRYYLDSPSRVKRARDTDVWVGSAMRDCKMK